MRGTPLERFEAKYTVQPNGCWQWTAGKSWKGYGRFRLNGKQPQAHRVAYRLYRGPVPDDLVIDHLCRNRLCVNPDHMEITTNRVNCCRGESPTIVSWREDRCIRGHPFDDANTIVSVRPSGTIKRRCRTCKNEQARRYNRRQVAA
jgi:hypothetical protein